MATFGDILSGQALVAYQSIRLNSAGTSFESIYPEERVIVMVHSE